MAKTEDDLSVNNTWQDLIDTFPALAGVPAYIQNKSFWTDRHLLIVFSDSDTAPDGPTGLRVPPGDVAQGSADHIWVRAFRENVSINCGTTD